MDKLGYSDYKIGLLALKYIPVIMFLIMWVHTGLSVFGINGPCADTVAGSAIIPSILILTISNLFKFCYLHKMLTIYSLCIDLCINFNRYIGFGDWLYPMRAIMFCMGIVILVILILKFNSYKEKCCTIKNENYGKEMLQR